MMLYIIVYVSIPVSQRSVYVRVISCGSKCVIGSSRNYNNGCVYERVFLEEMQMIYSTLN